jgi:hypothetical protein
MAATYEPIATFNITSAVTGCTFSSIPNTYTDLKLVAIYNDANNGALSAYGDTRIKLNGDTTASYAFTGLYGDGRANAPYYYGFTSGNAGKTTAGIAGQNLYGANTTFNQQVIDFMDYSATDKYKTWLVNGSSTLVGSWPNQKGVGTWANTSAINSIYWYTNDVGASRLVGKVTLYGIKAA